MTDILDLLIVGAGPAGLAAAVEAREVGLNVMVLDEQPAPGGQVWRALEARMGRAGATGRDEAAGAALLRAFRACGAAYRPASQVWQIEPGFDVYASRAGVAERIEARAVLLAVGAQERPVPFPGWTLPGVMPVGAAQILLKTSDQVPDDPVWIAGSGPLVLLYACQLLDAGGRIAGILDTTPPGNRAAALRHVPRALRNSRELAKGALWLWRLRRSGVPVTPGVSGIAALGGDALEAVHYRTASGEEKSVAARLLLVHEGIVPSIHMTLALGCAHEWRDEQMCFVPKLDDWGESSTQALFVAGDGGGIGGVEAAQMKGRIAAIGAAVRIGRLDPKAASARAAPLRARLDRALAIRPLLDALYRPRPDVLVPDDDTIVCRCEGVTAGQVREASRVGIAGPNQVKTFTRCGMGPCQGRMCGYTVSAILSQATGTPMAEIGLYRIRPPLKPITLGELAEIETEDVEVM